MCDDVEVVRSAYAAFARRDFAALLTLFDPDVELVHPPGSCLSGTHRGMEAALARFLVLLPTSRERLDTHPEEIRPAGDEIEVSGHHRGRNARGEAFEIPFVHTWTLREGFVVRLRSQVDAERFARVVGIADEPVPR